MTPTLRAAATTLLLAVIPGCVLGVEGVKQNLAFAVESPDAMLITPSASLPIATGSTITYAIYDLEPLAQGSGETRKRAPASLRSVWVDEDSPLTLGPVHENRVTIVATRPGRTRLHVRSERGLDELTLDVRDIDKVELLDARAVVTAVYEKQQPVSPALEGAPIALEDDTVRFVAVAADDAGHRLLGLGAEAPIVVTPADSATVEPTQGDLEHAIVRFRSAGHVTLTPRGGAAVSLEVVEPAEIASLRIMASSAALHVGQPEMLFAVGKLRGHDEERWIASSKVGFASLSPTICKVEAMTLHFTSGFASVRATEAGACKLGVELATDTKEKVFGVTELGVAARR